MLLVIFFYLVYYIYVIFLYVCVFIFIYLQEGKVVVCIMRYRCVSNRGSYCCGCERGNFIDFYMILCRKIELKFERQNLDVQIEEKGEYCRKEEENFKVSMFIFVGYKIYEGEQRVVRLEK